MADLKTYSVLIAWDDNDPELGEFGEIVRAANAEDAEAKARAAMREAHIANHCDWTDDADEIADSCADYEHEGFGGELVFGGRVIDLHEGAIWKSADLEQRLRDLLAATDEMAGRCGWADNGAREAARKIIAEIDAL